MWITFAYLTYEDIQTIPSLKEQTVIVIKAPAETKLEVPHPEEVCLNLCPVVFVMKLNIMNWNLSQTSGQLVGMHWSCISWNVASSCPMFRTSRSTSAALRGQSRCFSALITPSPWRPQMALRPMTATLTCPLMGTTPYPPYFLTRHFSRRVPKVSLAIKDPTVHLSQGLLPQNMTCVYIFFRNSYTDSFSATGYLGSNLTTRLLG